MPLPWKPSPDDELSVFLIVFLVGLFSLMLFVHVLQPERDHSGSSSRSPTHQGKQKSN